MADKIDEKSQQRSKSNVKLSVTGLTSMPYQDLRRFGYCFAREICSKESKQTASCVDP
jgi:hypothetical protein